jgi:hypothetical protein
LAVGGAVSGARILQEGAKVTEIDQKWGCLL